MSHANFIKKEYRCDVSEWLNKPLTDKERVRFHELSTSTYAIYLKVIIRIGVRKLTGLMKLIFPEFVKINYCEYIALTQS